MRLTAGLMVGLVTCTAVLGYPLAAAVYALAGACVLAVLVAVRRERS